MASRIERKVKWHEREKKLATWGFVLVIAGCLGILVALAPIWGVHIALYGVWGSTIAIMTGFIMFAVSGVISATIGQEANLALRWKRILMTDLAIFPETDDEKAAMRNGFVLKALTHRARMATNSFLERNKTEENLAGEKLRAATATELCITNLDDLKNYRGARAKRADFLAGYDGRYKNACSIADSAQKNYLDTWDLFRDMKMLPTNPGAKTSWTDPGEFRKYIAAQDRSTTNTACTAGTKALV